MPPPRELPGFYWDEEKKKYFMITDSHNFPTHYSVYTREKIKKHKLERDKKEAEQRAKELAATAFNRPSFTPFQSVRLHRVLGAELNEKNTQVGYLNGFNTMMLQWHNYDINYRFPVGASSPDDHVNTVQNNGGIFDVSFPLNKFVFSCGQADENFDKSSACFSELDKRCFPAQSVNYQAVHSQRANQLTTEPWFGLNHMRINPATRQLLVTQRFDDIGYNSEFYAMNDSGDFTTTGGAQLPSIDGYGTEVFDVAVPPPSSDLSFLISTASDYLSGIQAGDGRLAKIVVGGNRAWNRDNNLGQLLAIEMLEEGPDIVICGRRNGIVSCTDRRDRSYRVAILQHPARVSKVKQCGLHHIVVSGLENTMAIYDIRMLANVRTIDSDTYAYHVTNGTNNINRIPNYRGQGTLRRILGSKTVFTYPVVSMAHHNSGDKTNLDLAVDRSTGIVAAAQDSETEPIRCFSAYTGEVLHNIKTSNPRQGPVGQVRWVDDHWTGQGNPKSLWWGQGSNFFSSRWEDPEDEDGTMDAVQTYTRRGPITDQIYDWKPKTEQWFPPPLWRGADANRKLRAEYHDDD